MLAALFRRRPSLPIVPIPKQVLPALFKQNPPWWARWALVLVALDVMVASVFLLLKSSISCLLICFYFNSTSAIELTWNFWTIAPDPKKDTSKGTETPVPSDKPVLQPVWKRSAFCLVHFMSGCAVAGSILAARSRVVRSITVSQRSTDPNVGLRLYLETAGHPLNHAHEFYLKRCKLVEWKNNKVSIEVKDHGRWLLDLRGASINGAAALSPSLNYASMVKAWQMARQRPLDIHRIYKRLKKIIK